MAKIITGSVLTKIYSLILIIVLSLSLFSCGSKKNDDDIPSEEDAYDTYIAELITSIKKNPSQYNGKQVNVKGGVIKNDNGEILLVDHPSPEGARVSLEVKKGEIASIKIVISDPLSRNVVETGDYINVYGTVQISDEGIYLDNCNISILTAVGEKS